MFGLKKPHLHRHPKQTSVDPGLPVHSKSNPFDSDDESDTKTTTNPAQRTSSEPTMVDANLRSSLFDENEVKGTSSSSNSVNHTARNRYKNDFRESGGLENQSVQELEDYSVYKAEETTKTVNSCLKIAEDIREDATKTLVSLHHQGEQITRIHMVAADIDQDLSRGEKLIGNLGGIFSGTWKPKKNHHIKGPVDMRDDPAQRRGNHLEQREKLGLTPARKNHSNSRTPPPEPSNALQKVEVEKNKQDDGLSELSDLLAELKGMAVDMGSELERQPKALDALQDDVDEVDSRVKNGNARIRRLLGK